jgi:hypothetical protein
MAHVGIYATKAECDAMAGENVDVTGWTESNINLWCLEAEGLIHCTARKVFATIIADFTAMPAGGKGLLAEIEACAVAMQGIAYNMNGYTSRIEAEDMINILHYKLNRDLELLRDQKVVNFIVQGS